MALIKCDECSREISDKAAACPGCGAPLIIDTGPRVPPLPRTLPPSLQAVAPVRYNPESDSFAGSMTTMVKLAMRSVQELGWMLDQVNEALGLVTFQTGMSWGSWSGISGSLNIEEVSAGVFRVRGTGKQNLRGGQLIALNIGGEAQGKARRVIEQMKQLADQRATA